MIETPFYFPSARGDRLFGVLHEPRSGGRDEAYVFCHPLAEEKLWSHRVFVAFARKLASRGFPVLRFDMGGEGDSDGRFDEATIDSRLDDIAVAMTRVRRHLEEGGRVSLLGLRLGATLAHLVAAREPQTVERIVMWEPVVSGEAYLQELLRANLANQMAVQGRVSVTRKDLTERLDQGEGVNVEGYQVSASFARALRHIILDESPLASSGSLILQIGREGQTARDELVRLAADESHVKLDTVVEQPFWRETRFFFGHSEPLAERTLDWLDNIYE